MTRRRLILAGVVLLALVGAFATGRYTRTVATRDETHATNDTKAAVTTVAHAEEAKHETATRDTDTTIRTVTRWRPAVAAASGCPAIPASIEQETIRETHAASTRTADTKRAQQVQQHAESEQHQTVVTLHTAESRPTWSATALVGGQLGGRRLFDAVVPVVVVGVAFERRILGPVSAGLWATSGMAGGVAVRVDW